MGPFPHDTFPPEISDANPMGTDGFEFIEYAHPEPEKLAALFETMGFQAVAKHRSKNVTLYRQGDVNYVINAEPDSFAAEFARAHGPCACAMGFRVVDAKYAYERAIELGAEPFETNVGPMELSIPAIRGIGGSLYYLDHLTHNVFRGRMDYWAGWYTKFFNFRQIRFFDIEGRVTGLHSRAMTSPCGKTRIPINESADRGQPDRGVSRRVQGRGHPACRLRL